MHWFTEIHPHTGSASLMKERLECIQVTYMYRWLQNEQATCLVFRWGRTFIFGTVNKWVYTYIDMYSVYTQMSMSLFCHRPLEWSGQCDLTKQQRELFFKGLQSAANLSEVILSRRHFMFINFGHLSCFDKNSVKFVYCINCHHLIGDRPFNGPIRHKLVISPQVVQRACMCMMLTSK